MKKFLLMVAILGVGFGAGMVWHQWDGTIADLDALFVVLVEKLVYLAILIGLIVGTWKMANSFGAKREKK